MFLRTNVSADGKLPQPLRGGHGFIGQPSVHQRVAETDETLTVNDISGGIVQQQTTLTSDVSYTLPTAALILAEYPEMDIGDTITLFVKNAQAAAFDVVLVVGAGITKLGTNNTLSTPPQATNVFTLEKSAAAAMILA